MNHRILLILLVSHLLFFPIFYGTTFSEGVYGQTSDTDWWPMFQNDPAHTGSSSSIVPETNETLWSFYVERIYSVGNAPSVFNERVFVGSGRFFWCINSSTGVLLWSHKKPYLDPSTSPAVSNGKVVISGGQNILYCFNVENGDLVWNFTAESWLRSSPVIDNGRVFVGTDDDGLYCLNETNGNLLWNYNSRNSINASPTVVDDRVFVTTEDGTLRCIDVSFGKPLWAYTLSGGGNFPSVVFYQGKVLIGTSHGNNTLYCLNSISGELVWKYETEGWLFASPAVANGKVFIGDRSNIANIYCLDVLNGSLIWKHSYENEFGAEYSSPVVADGKIVICMGRKLYVLNQINGEIIWNYDPPYGAHDSRGFTGQSVALADGRIYVASDEGSLYCFGPMIYYDLTLTPQYLNNKLNSFIPLPTSCTFEFSNGTEINASTPTSFQAPLGTFSINNVTWIGYGVLTVRNQISIYLDSNLVWNPIVNCTLPTFTSLYLSSSTSSVGFNIDLNGRLTCNEEGVSSAPILISYSVTDGETWNELTQAHTDQNGQYSAIWMPTVSGRYIIKAVWSGNITFPKSSMQTYLSVLPVQELDIISVASNSGVYNLIFNSSTKELRFNLMDSSESSGYSDVFIPKDIVGNVEAEVFCDGKKVELDISSIEDSWLLHFNYIGDVDEVVISLTEASTPFGIPNTELLPVLLVVGVFVVCGIVIYFSRRKR